MITTPALANFFTPLLMPVLTQFMGKNSPMLSKENMTAFLSCKQSKDGQLSKYTDKFHITSSSDSIHSPLEQTDSFSLMDIFNIEDASYIFSRIYDYSFISVLVGVAYITLVILVMEMIFFHVFFPKLDSMLSISTFLSRSRTFLSSFIGTKTVEFTWKLRKGFFYSNYFFIIWFYVQLLFVIIIGGFPLVEGILKQGLSDAIDSVLEKQIYLEDLTSYFPVIPHDHLMVYSLAFIVLISSLLSVMQTKLSSRPQYLVLTFLSLVCVVLVYYTLFSIVDIYNIELNSYNELYSTGKIVLYRLTVNIVISIVSFIAMVCVTYKPSSSVLQEYITVLVTVLLLLSLIHMYSCICYLVSHTPAISITTIIHLQVSFYYCIINLLLNNSSKIITINYY